MEAFFAFAYLIQTFGFLCAEDRFSGQCIAHKVFMQWPIVLRVGYTQTITIVQTILFIITFIFT